MALFKKEQKEQTLPLYEVHCTECGERIENKFFPLDTLLDQYYNGTAIAAPKQQMIRTLGIGALYGAPVLPDVPPLVEKTEDGMGFKVILPKPEDIQTISCGLPSFACEDKELHNQTLAPVNLNIAAIVAQFYLMSGFYKIYTMLDLQKQIEDGMFTGQDTSSQQAELDMCCDLFASLPQINVGAMGTTDNTRSAVAMLLSSILQFAQTEAQRPGERHFATETLMAGWRYKIVNGRQMPLELVVMGATTRGSYHCSACCCDKCHLPISHEFGAYRQKIVGLLGTQKTGKTTYLTALADAVGKITSITESNGNQRLSNTEISPTMAGDSQWTRVKQAPGKGSKGGSLWMYQNGFPPEKTDVKVGEAPALSFLVQKEGREPILYTLADIPGEVFYAEVAKDYDPNFIKKISALLRTSNAFIMVLNSQQMRSVANEDGTNKLVQDPSAVLDCYKGHMPKNSVPTAVVVTAADLINDGDLRQSLNLAYDIRRLSPLVWSDQKQALVYNAEAMRNAGSAVGSYLDREFGIFMKKLETMLTEAYGPKGVLVNAFAVSNGTQHAPKDYLEATDTSKEDYDPDYLSQQQMARRYQRMQESRFGLAGPLLWILTCDGMLDVSR